MTPDIKHTQKELSLNIILDFFPLFLDYSSKCGLPSLGSKQASASCTKEADAWMVAASYQRRNHHGRRV